MTDLTYTDPSVFEGIAAGADWADPVMNPEEIDWPTRQRRAAIPFQVVNGRPVNPCEKTAVRYGRNNFGHWGEQLMADALVTVTTAPGLRWLPMVERGDGRGWAVPGGYVDPGETAAGAALRELAEETGLDVSGYPHTVREMPPRYVPDPRASDEAWAVTVPVRITLEIDGFRRPALTGGDDARRAGWVFAGPYPLLAAHLAGVYGGKVFPAHAGMLAEFLGTGAA